MTPSPKRFGRRTFLKMGGGLCGYATLIRLSPTRLWLPPDNVNVAVPPSLMLHSADGRFDFLPRLLALLNDAGFQGTTYREWGQSLAAGQSLPNPVIISVDDISVAQGSCASFDIFAQMKRWFKEAGMTAVFGVITEPVIGGEPQRQQDEARWDLMGAWVEEGFELATHTSYHSNFNARDTGPRPDFTARDYEAEIVRSASLIEQQLAQRGRHYQVQTLITPYGSGYSYMQPEPQIHDGITAACSQTSVKYVVGIAQGRAPLPLADLLDEGVISYLGRIPPAYNRDASGQSTPNPERTLSWLRSW